MFKGENDRKHRLCMVFRIPIISWKLNFSILIFLNFLSALLCTVVTLAITTDMDATIKTQTYVWLPYIHWKLRITMLAQLTEIYASSGLMEITFRRR